MSFLSHSSENPPEDAAQSDAFRAVITPHRALSIGQYLVLASLTLMLTLIIQVPLVRVGAWPSAIFGGGEALLLLVAVLLHRRSQQRTEVITVSTGSLHILRRCRGRVIDARRFSVFGLRVVRIDDPEYGCQSVAVELRGRRTEIARDLSPGERAGFAEAVANAIGQNGSSSHVRIEMRRSLLGHLTPGEAR